MKNLLVPIDFSFLSNEAVHVARILSNLQGSRIHLYHVMEPTDVDRFENETDDLHDHGITSIEKLDRKIKILTQEHKLTNYQTYYELGYKSVHQSVVEKAEELDADLIIMGAFGVHGTKKHIGSNAERIIRTSETPVLSIRKQVDDFYPSTVVFASRFLKEAETAWYKVQPFVNAFDSMTHLLRVISPAQFERSSVLMGLMNKFGYEHKINPFSSNVYVDQTVEEGIKNFSEEMQADVIALTVHRNRRLNLIVGQKSKNSIVNSSTKAVLSVRISDEPQIIDRAFAEKEYQEYISDEYYEVLGRYMV